MKNKLIRLVLLLYILVLSFSLNVSFAQPPAPPRNGVGGNQGSSAPLADGVEMSLLLAAAYGGFVLYKIWKEKKKTLPGEGF